jgi:TetR/AcrR family transcriptional regulator, regulator of cefoperazone and chloramphenicol sensitivity
MKDGALDRENAVRQRLVDAAAKVFAEKGFSQATIREISMRAGANVAAISYYWRDKESLYKRVVEELIIERTQSYPLAAAMDESVPPEARLKKFVELFLHRLLDSGRPASSGKIMVREITQPTEAVTVVLDKLVKPTFDVLTSIVRAICGDGISEDRVKLAAVSIISQCAFYFNAGNIMDMLVEKELLPEFDLEEVAEHITEFSLRGLGRD